MSINRSMRYEQIHDRTWDQFVTPPASELDEYWFKKVAPKWRNRVGIPRLVAESASFEADGLLRSINAGLFRNDPELLEKLRDAQEAVAEFTQSLARQNWERFEGEPR